MTNFDRFVQALKSPRLLLAVALSTVSAGLIAGPITYRANEVRLEIAATEASSSIALEVESPSTTQVELQL